ncbi:hypothetical protein BX265_2043 [Streptomyces sp. TLI_235]|nr:hypothetical protein [Streptomyces sp. TLI_235]PBC77300.1 hypothetical protein BX265_2043 [Streptomyces sp. TLI_235]
MSTPSLQTDEPIPVAAAAEAAPVFVDQSGARGRRLRGLGWLVGGGGLLFTAGMIGSLFGAVAQAPPLQLPESLPSPTAVASPSPSPSPTTSGKPKTSAKPTTAAHSGSASARPSGSASKSAGKTTASHSPTTRTAPTGTRPTTATAKPAR